MLANVRPHPDLAQQQALLMLVSVVFLLGLLVLPLAIVQKATDRRVGVGVNLYQVEVTFLSKGQGLGTRQNTQVLASVPY
jgi:hypothetical protein